MGKHYRNSIRGVTDGRHKLIEYSCGPTQLFDLSRDPSEMDNIADKDPSSTVVSEMRRKLTDLADEWDDAEHPMGRNFWAKRSDLRQQ